MPRAAHRTSTGLGSSIAVSLFVRGMRHGTSSSVQQQQGLKPSVTYFRGGAAGKALATEGVRARLQPCRECIVFIPALAAACVEAQRQSREESLRGIERTFFVTFHLDQLI